MSRPLRIEYPGAVYHITSRGNAKNKIFADDMDRETFLSVLHNVLIRYNWLCHAYCLMNNHYHLIIETPDGNLSLGMRQLNGVYTQRYNRRHKKTGHIFQGRFKAILVEKESYLLELCRYVVLNPIRAKIVENPKQWRWSSYCATAGFKKPPEYLSVNWILGLFSDSDSRRKTAQERYLAFIKEGMDKTSPWEELEGQIFLGGKDFMKKFKEILSDKKQIKEISRRQRYSGRPSLAELLGKGDEKLRRDKSILDAHKEYGYTLKEIADYLQIHYTTVSKVITEGMKNEK